MNNKVNKNTNIIGIFNGTIDDLVRPFKDTKQLTKALILAPMYIKYCEKFRIKTDIAFADMCVKTAKFTKKANNHNFTNDDLMVIAHVAHLAWYLYPDHKHSLCSRKFDPDHFEKAGKHHPEYTGNTTIKILDDYQKVISIVNTINNVSTISDELKPSKKRKYAKRKKVQQITETRIQFR